MGVGISGVGSGRWFIGISIAMGMGMGIGPGLVFVAQYATKPVGLCVSFGSLTGEPGVLTAFAE